VDHGYVLCFHTNETANLIHYSGYTATEIRPVMRLMMDYLARKEVLHDAFFKKYAAKKYMKASIIVREWIQTEYTEEEVTSVKETVEVEVIEEDIGQENTPEDDIEEENENENQVSEEDDYMYANELEEHEV
jgi:Cyclin, C-terminal domain